MINLSNIINIKTKQNISNSLNKNTNPVYESYKPFHSEEKAIPSPENYRAMYLSFGARKKQPELPEFFSDMLAEQDLAEQIRLKSYDRTASLIAQNVFKGKSTIALYQKGAMQALVANSFAQNLADGKYKNIGMTKDNTEVYFLNSGEAAEVASSSIETNVQERIKNEGEGNRSTIYEEELNKPILDTVNISQFFSKKTEKGNKNIIVFVSDPEKFMFSSYGDSMKMVYFVEAPPEEKSEKTPLISLIKNEDEGIISKGKNNLPQVAKNILNFAPETEILDLPLVGAPETKSFLNKYMSRLYVLPEGVKIPPSTINYAVDVTKKREGAYPDKALKLIESSLPAALLEKKIKPGAKSVIITPKNIDKAVNDFPEAFEPEIDFEEKPYNLTLDTKTKLSDIGGIGFEEKNIRETLINKIQKKKTTKSDVYPPSNILITGASGSGKTLLAKAIAGETQTPFIHVSAVKLFNMMYMSMISKSPQEFDIKDIFDFAKETAHDSDNKTAIIFIDDLDVMVDKYNKLVHPMLEEKNIKDIYLSNLLKQVKSIDNKNSDINLVVIGSCKYPELMQDEFNKTGVFNERICAPDNRLSKETRLATLNLFTKGKNFESDEEKKYVISETARVTDGASGAELKTVVEKADKLVKKRPDNKFITINDMLGALLEMESGPITQTDRTESENKATIKHELGHAVVLKALINKSKEKWQKPNEIGFITFDPRGYYGAAVYLDKGQDKVLTFDSLINEIAGSFGGSAVEKQLFKGRSTEGPYFDLEHINTLAEVGVKKLNLGHHTGPMSNADLYKAENKKDITAIVRTGEKIADLIVDFHKDFIEEYGNECADNLGKAGNTLSAKVFDERYNQWLDKDNRRKKLELVNAKVEVLIDSARTKGKFIKDDKKLEEKAKKQLQNSN